MLSAGGPILAQRGELRASSPQATSALASAIARAATDEAQIGLAGIGVPVAGPDGQHAIAHVLPLKFGQLRPDLAHGAVAAVFVTPAQMAPLPPVEALAALYELTPMEARVLLEIASGKNRAASADAARHRRLDRENPPRPHLREDRHVGAGRTGEVGGKPDPAGLGAHDLASTMNADQ
jgi:hypothetical protein